MISKKIGIVESIVDQNGELDDIRVKINGELQRAYNYPKITGHINRGDEVLLNTTAVNAMIIINIIHEAAEAYPILKLLNAFL